MRHLTFGAVLLLALATGCTDTEKKPDDGAPPPQKTQPKPQPKPQPQPQPVKPAEEAPVDDAPIVIRGSKRGDSTSTGTVSDAERQRKIDELAAKAKASQGKDNGQPYREDPGAAPSPGKADKIKARIADIDAQAGKLQDEKAAMTHPGGGRRGVRNPDTVDDPERAKAIDGQLSDLKKEREILQRKLVELEVSGDGSSGPPPAK
jgi:colicin import membrane protein